MPGIETALEGWGTRVPTSKLNQFFADLVNSHPHPVRGGKRRVLFATQAGVRPPRFVLFTSGFLEEGYRRFIERRLREEFGFAGTPLDITMKIRESAARAASNGNIRVAARPGPFPDGPRHVRMHSTGRE